VRILLLVKKEELLDGREGARVVYEDYDSPEPKNRRNLALCKVAASAPYLGETSQECRRPDSK
jgi:hypothetical protein